MSGFGKSIATTLVSRIVAVYLVFAGCFMALLAGAVNLGFAEIEAGVIAEDAVRVENAIGIEIDSLTTLCREYSVWDETYAFMETGDREFIDYNMPREWRRRVDLGLVAFMKSDGAILWAARIADGDFVPGGADPAVLERLAELVRRSAADGLERQVIFGPGPAPLYAAIEPVVRSDGGGKPRGYLAFGKYLDQSRIAGLAEATRTTIGLTGVSPAPAEETATPSSPERDPGRRFAVVRTGNRISAALRVHRPDGDVVALEVSRNRDLWSAGQRLLWFVGLSVTGMNVLSGIVLIALLKGLVVRPILLISRFLEGVIETEDFSRRLHLPRQDESGALAEDISGLLSHIESRSEELRRLNQELEKVANTDRLTGLPNRRMMETHMSREIRRLRRDSRGNEHRGHLSVLLCDVDFFKLYNDTYGHPAGDACLTAIGAAIQGCIHRAEDLACRYGGEEFLIVLPECGEEGARCVAERILEAVRSLELPHAASSVADRVTISVGGASCGIGDTFDQASLLEAADGALYRAKREGRNRYRDCGCGAEGGGAGLGSR
jgi:diguanylate cyclase (GGDEF)-like protein